MLIHKKKLFVSICIFIACILILLIFISNHSALDNEMDPLLRKSLDKPIAVQKIDLPEEDNNPMVKRSVICSTYSSFVVKEVNYGEKGAALSVIPMDPQLPTVCNEKNQANEYVIDWSGYFYGVKDGYAFFSADDRDLGGGQFFMVLRLHDKKIVFEDSAATSAKNGIEIKSIQVDKSGLKLNYLRNYFGGCSVLTDGEACLNNISKNTGVTNDFKKICIKKYRISVEVMAKSRCEVQEPSIADCFQKELKSMLDDQQWDTTPSYVTYNVEAFIPNDAPPVDPKMNDTAVIQEFFTKFLKKKSDVIDCTPSL